MPQKTNELQEELNVPHTLRSQTKYEKMCDSTQLIFVLNKLNDKEFGMELRWQIKCEK